MSLLDFHASLNGLKVNLVEIDEISNVHLVRSEYTCYVYEAEFLYPASMCILPLVQLT